MRDLNKFNQDLKPKNAALGGSCCDESILLKRVTFSIYLFLQVLLTPDGLDESNVVSMLDRSVSCCVMLLASSYRAHVLEKLTDC